MDSVAKPEIVPFRPELLGPVRAFSDGYWSRPREDPYFRWRYLEAPASSRLFLAMQDGHCLGMLFALQKTYLAAGRPMTCLETFDWHSLPEQRGSGVGIRLMRAMMKQPERLFSVGGTHDVHSTLPLMGWKQIGEALTYDLAVSGELLAARVARRSRLPLALLRPTVGAAWGALFPPRRLSVPPGAEVTVGPAIGPEILALYEGDTGYGLLQRPSLEHLEWVTRNTWCGTYRFLRFARDGNLRGWAMTRVFEGPHGAEGVIVELFAPRPDLALYIWMVSEAVVSMVAQRPRRIRARATCPILQEALRANRFTLRPPSAPIHTWPTNVEGIAGPLHFTYNHSDGPLLPYESERLAARHDHS